MSFLRAEFPSLLQLFVFLIHVINGLFVAHNVLVITPSGAIFSVESVIMNSAYLKRSQPCPYNTNNKKVFNSINHVTTVYCDDDDDDDDDMVTVVYYLETKDKVKRGK